MPSVVDGRHVTSRILFVGSYVTTISITNARLILTSIASVDYNNHIYAVICLTIVSL